MAKEIKNENAEAVVEAVSKTEQFFEKNGVLMTAQYHPAALLRDPAKKPDTFVDLKRLHAKIRQVCTHTHLDF